MLEAKVAFALIVLVVIAFTIEQEKMIWLAIPPSIMVIALCFTMSTHNFFADNESKINSVGEEEKMKVSYSMFKFEETYLYIALNMFCYQAMSTFFTIRNSMRNPQEMIQVIPRAYILVLITVLATCTAFYMFYGDEN